MSALKYTKGEKTILLTLALMRAMPSTTYLEGKITEVELLKMLPMYATEFVVAKKALKEGGLLYETYTNLITLSEEGGKEAVSLIVEKLLS